ncbi:small-subunit processome [Daldinia decipiens]|uniref:small-subunit processome n=1 Tax=Daldinia decipiens TaxID=326647 RepID=UPI0020C25846|nr:small-subunit processome [Daldinia decipiens]KAI1661980.1 small-subunit processome [Daldinia decipiens]
MPGRQAHGRPVGGGTTTNGKSKKRSKSKSTKKALNAFAIASEEYADRQKRTPRNRELDIPLSGGGGGGKHARDEDDDEDDDEDEEEGPPKKMRRGAERDEDVEYGSDSSGNEWRVGVDEDDDSEIESDDAFGESDQERFEDYAFRGSKKKPKKKDDDEDDDSDEDIGDADGASLGSDAIDLAAALDMSMSEDDGEPGADDESGSDEEESDEDGAASGNESSDIEDDEDDDVSDSGINAWVSKFGGVKDTDDQDVVPTKKPKIGLKDLGLLGIKDPQLKKSLKLMTKEEKSSKPQKLEVPLARRQQAKLDRTVAYEKTNESLDRWTETVKHNRRADHLVFPLPQTETGLARHNNTEIQPLNRKAPGTELEKTILAIMEESGLGPSTKKETKQMEDLESADAEGFSGNNLKALWQEKRRERELKSREDARSKRIKKIKSKAYHRVHRKQRERDEMKEHEAMVAAGEVDSEDEREAQDRQRAVERMGARHRESKWAKMSNKNKRAAWDDDVRVGIADMARRDEELRRRIEGKPAKTNGDSDEDSDYSGGSDDVDERKRLLQQLDNVSDDDDAPKSKLMNMEFMKKAEAAKRKANDELIAEIRRDLASDDEAAADSDDEGADIGRRKFGQPSGGKLGKSSEKLIKASKDKVEVTDLQAARDNIAATKSGRSKGLSAPVSQDVDPSSIAGAWSQPTVAGPARKQKSRKTGSSAEVLELGIDSVAIAASAAPAKKPKPSKKQAIANGNDSSDDETSHLPIQFREQDLIEKAFGGLDVVAEFEQEKAAIEAEDDDKVIDNTLPGWGSWVGDGVSNREKKRHQGRFLTKQEGVKKKDRKDVGMQNVIVNEKRIKKNDKFMASQLPHPYESRLQYERALRLPVGPEWMTKETFQEATKPRILMKQGIIAPIMKPTH